MVKAAEVTRRIELPEGVTAHIHGNQVTVEGPKGKLVKTFILPGITMTHAKNAISLHSRMPRKKEMALLGTIEGHIRNMIRGVTDGFEYTLKLVYSHFPVKLSVDGNRFVIGNFLGEKSPRYASILGEAKVNIDKDNTVKVTGIDKEHVGQTAANIEQATKIKGYDPKVFQDGIYIIDKR